MVDPVEAVLVFGEHDVGAADGFDAFVGAGVHDGAGHAGGGGHGQERAVEGVAAGHAKRRVGGAAGGVEAELVFLLGVFLGNI